MERCHSIPTTWLSDAVLWQQRSSTSGRDWAQGPVSVELRTAAEAIRGADDAMQGSLRRFIGLAIGLGAFTDAWVDSPVGVLTRGLYSAARQHEHSRGTKVLLLNRKYLRE
jgi:hypothetical protein